jgi:hypothetical protein
VLGICGVLFIGFNIYIYAAMGFDLRNFAACPRAFYSFNAFLLGIAITSAFLLRLDKKPTGAQNGDHGVASNTVATSGTEPVSLSQDSSC